MALTIAQNGLFRTRPIKPYGRQTHLVLQSNSFFAYWHVVYVRSIVIQRLNLSVRQRLLKQGGMIRQKIDIDNIS